MLEIGSHAENVKTKHTGMVLKAVFKTLMRHPHAPIHVYLELSRIFHSIHFSPKHGTFYQPYCDRAILRAVSRSTCSINMLPAALIRTKKTQWQALEWELHSCFQKYYPDEKGWRAAKTNSSSYKQNVSPSGRDKEKRRNPWQHTRTSRTWAWPALCTLDIWWCLFFAEDTSKTLSDALQKAAELPTAGLRMRL